MGVTKKLTYFVLGIVSIFGSIQKSFAKIVGDGKLKIKFLTNIYEQSGKGGDQIYNNSNKEDVSVIEPMLFLAYEVDEETSVNAHLIFDTWTAASDTALDGSTGASGEGIGRQSRVAGNFSYNKDKKTWAWSSRFGVSSEYDYRSVNFGGHLEGRFKDENFVLSFSPQVFLDQAKNFDYQTQKVTEFKSRTIASFDLSASQLLTASDIIQFGYTHIMMNGNMNNISNSVKVTSNPYSNTFSRVEERLPDSRTRHAFNTKWVHGFTDEIATHLSFRNYKDSWKVEANTAEFGYRNTFMEDSAFMMLTYRYHKQSKTKYYAPNFSTVQQFMTSDSDLEKFDSKRYGVHFSKTIEDMKLKSFDLEEFNLSGGIYKYDRSNDLDYWMVQFGVSAAI